MGSGQFQMVGLGGAGHTAAGQKRPPQKGSLAAVLFHDGQIDMQGKGAAGIKAEGGHNGFNLLRTADDKHQFARCSLLRQGIKAHGKGLAEQPGQQSGKILAFRNDFNLGFRKAVAKQQNAETLGQGAAAGLGNFFTNLRLGGRGKGQHGVLLSF